MIPEKLEPRRMTRRGSSFETERALALEKMCCRATLIYHDARLSIQELGIEMYLRMRCDASATLHES